MIILEPPSSSEGDAVWSGLRKAVLARFLKSAQRAVELSGEVNLLLADDARLKSLNKAFRGKNKPTDVLSFPAADNGEGMVGDLAVSVETAARQAAEHGHSLEDELRVLTLHGLLHLAGYDHEADTGEMRAREAELRTRLKLPGGLIERTEAPGAARRKPTAAATKEVQPAARKQRTQRTAKTSTGSNATAGQTAGVPSTKTPVARAQRSSKSVQATVSRSRGRA